MKLRYLPLPPLAQIAREAGDIILAMQDDIAGNKKWETKSDGSPVTPADKKAHAIIKQRLAEAFPGVALVSEEGTQEEREEGRKAKDRIDCDPLDNTRGYMKGHTGFSVNLGRITNGEPVEGAVYFPARKELYYTQSGKAYRQKGNAPPEQIHVQRLPLRSPLRVTTGFNEQNFNFIGNREYQQYKHPAQYRTCMVAAGECDITGLNKGGSGGYNSWDVAGPHAVLLAAGGDFITEDGRPMRYGDSTKVPPHIGGGVDTLKALGLADPHYFRAVRAVGY